MKKEALFVVAVAVGLLAGCSNEKDRQAAMKNQFSTLDSNFIADISAADSREKALIDEDQQRFSNAIMSMHLTLTNIEIASQELTNASSKESAKLLLLMSIREEKCELQRAEATNTMLLAKLNWFYTNPMPIAQDAPSNDLRGIVNTLSDSLTKRRRDEIVEAGLNQLEEIVRQKTQQQLAQQQLSIEKPSFTHVDTNSVPTNWTFTTLQGRTYSNVIVESSDPISVRFRFSDGGESRVFLTNLFPEDRATFHYDKTKADAFADEQAADAARRAADSRIRREFNDQKTRIVNTGRFVSATIFQIVKDGVLVNVNRGYSASELWMLWQYPSAGLADGQRLTLQTYRIGTYQYDTVNGSSKTILRFTASLETALRLDFYDKHPDWPLQSKPEMTPEQIQEMQREQKLEAQLRGIDYSPIP